VVGVAAIAVAIVVYLDGSERILSILGSVFSAGIGFASALSAYIKPSWASDQGVPPMLLRDVIPMSSTVGSTVSYLAGEIESWQHHPLVIDHTLFADIVPFVAVPHVYPAKMAMLDLKQRIEELQKKLEESIPKELAQLDDIREAMKHIIHDLAPQNNLTTEQPTLSQKEKKYRRVVKQHLRELIKLFTAMVKCREIFEKDVKDIENQIQYAEKVLDELRSDVEVFKNSFERRLFDTGGNGDSSGTATMQEQKQELISRMEDAGGQVWLEYVEMEIVKIRAKKAANTFHLELSTIKYLRWNVALLLRRVKDEEVEVGDAATHVLNVLNMLIKSLKERYSKEYRD
jgi:hypothetical protein